MKTFASPICIPPLVELPELTQSINREAVRQKWSYLSHQIQLPDKFEGGKGWQAVTVHIWVLSCSGIKGIDPSGVIYISFISLWTELPYSALAHHTIPCCRWVSHLGPETSCKNYWGLKVTQCRNFKVLNIHYTTNIWRSRFSILSIYHQGDTKLV